VRICGTALRMYATRLLSPGPAASCADGRAETSGQHGVARPAHWRPVLLRTRTSPSSRPMISSDSVVSACVTSARKTSGVLATREGADERRVSVSSEAARRRDAAAALAASWWQVRHTWGDDHAVQHGRERVLLKLNWIARSSAARRCRQEERECALCVLCVNVGEDHRDVAREVQRMARRTSHA
jgi:hypothetical protein